VTVDDNPIHEKSEQVNNAEQVAIDKKAKIAAAVAKAKARKLAEKTDVKDVTVDDNPIHEKSEQVNNAEQVAIDKKAKIAAAVAKAKARKLAAQQAKSAANPSDEITNEQPKSESI